MVLDLSRTGFRIVVHYLELPTSLEARLNLPDNLTLRVQARLRWRVELDSNTCHCGFEILDFLDPDGESQLTKFLHLELSSASDSMQAELWTCL